MPEHMGPVPPPDSARARLPGVIMLLEFTDIAAQLSAKLMQRVGSISSLC